MNTHPALRRAVALAVAARCLAPLAAADNQVPTSLLRVADPNLEVTVWAASPLLRNPTNLDVDKDGRIWVAEGVNYRSHYNREPAGDRIMVLEDTDGDGVADKAEPFVQEEFLRAPLGVAVIDNRIVVSMSPDIVVYTDVNRDRKFDPAVDRREVLLHGFNGRRHDHTVHSVTVGPDGQYYWNSGNCGALFTDKSGRTFRIGSSYDPGSDLGWSPRELAGQRSDDGHVWVGGFAARMNPDGSGVHIIGHNFRNSYEQTVTAFGDVFQNDNDDPPACRTTFLLEYGNAGFSSADGQRSWGADRRPGQDTPTAEWRQEDPGTMPSGDVYGGGSPTGIAYVENSALGGKYRGLLLSCEPGRNVVFGYLPKPEGAGFRLERFDFLTSNPEGEFAGTDFKGGRNEDRELKTLFRPSDVVVGVDGAIYVADWYDARVGGHADWDDTTSGTIYRVAPKGFRPKVPKVDYGTLPGAMAGLRSPAVNVRGAAQYALEQRGAAALPPLRRMLANAKNPHLKARAVWMLARLGAEGREQVRAVLKDADAQLRVTAFRALRRHGDDLPGLIRQFASDPSPAMRREVALALRDLPFAESRDALVTLARSYDGEDRTYLEAWGTGATGKEAELYGVLRSELGGNDPAAWSPAFARLAWRLHPEASVPDFLKRALATSLPEADRKAAVVAIGTNPGRAAADAMVDIAAKSAGLVKAEAVWWLLHRKDSQWRGMDLDVALRQRGIYDPENVELIATPVPPAEKPRYGVEAVAKLQGDPVRGAAQGAACLSCHRVGATGVEYAPNLTGWARRQTTEVLLKSVIEPSAEIAHGFNGTALTLKDGTEIHGVVLADGDPVIVASAGGVTQMIPKGRIQERKGLGRSLMLSADQLGLEPQDLADIAAWLKTQ